MKQTYGDINYLQQQHVAGLCNMQVTPREWLQSDPIIDFATGKVLITPTLKAGRFWLQMQMVPQSYNYDVQTKDSKAGTYKEIKAGGTLNVFNYRLQQILETIEKSDLVTVIDDRKGRKRIIGNTTSAMKLSYEISHKNNPGMEKISLQLTYTSEIVPPYYNPDAVPDLDQNFLIDSDGNFLLVE